MRLIIPIPYHRHGGVERVAISIITEISKQIEQVIIVSSPKNIDHFQAIIPDSHNIIYEPFLLPNNFIIKKYIRLIERLDIFLRKVNFHPIITNNLKRFKNNLKNQIIIEFLISKYQADYCLYVLGNKIKPPQLHIPLCLIIHDIFWHFSPLSYSEDFVNRYDENLLQWFQEVDKFITVSDTTKSDMLTIFPHFKHKVFTVSNAGFIPQKSELEIAKNHNQPIKNTTYFLFPSSFGIYKDHLTLLKAGLILAEKNPNFKIVLIGKETDKVIQGEISLSQQKQTQQYQEYLQNWQTICKENKALIDKHFLGLGFCSETELENWYQKADCVIFPSQYEGFGLGISEGIMRGIPVIASDLEVFTEQVDLYQCPDRITFFDKGNPEDLASKLTDFINNPQPKLTGEKLEYYRQLWTWEKVAEKYIEVMSK